MKRPLLILLAAFLALVSIPASAQDDFSRKPVFRAGWGGYPYLDMVFLRDGSRDTFRDYSSLRSIYQKSYETKHITSVISVTCDIPILSWLSIPVITAFDIGYRPYHDPAARMEKTEYSADLQVLAGARFTYFRRKYFGIYSAIALGLQFARLPDCEVYPAFQPVPFGMTFGSRFFGFAEIGLGTMYTGGMAGIGYRF
ncbi:MAG: hypothetical protein MJY56_02770 [Bacteroidales bacterium]|nr:hypothetical protein [Bacteroidales bacterium]